MRCTTCGIVSAKGTKMALFRYLHPIDKISIDPHGPLSRSVPPSVLTEVNSQVKKAEAEVRPKKRGPYLTLTAEEKARVARYGSNNGARAAIKRFSKCIWRHRAWRVTKFRTTKIISVDHSSFSRKLAPPKISRYTVYFKATGTHSIINGQGTYIVWCVSETQAYVQYVVHDELQCAACKSDIGHGLATPTVRYWG